MAAAGSATVGTVVLTERRVVSGVEQRTAEEKGKRKMLFFGEGEKCS
jgi:hypothetical protein